MWAHWAGWGVHGEVRAVRGVGGGGKVTLDVVHMTGQAVSGQVALYDTVFVCLLVATLWQHRGCVRYGRGVGLGWCVRW